MGLREMAEANTSTAETLRQMASIADRQPAITELPDVDTSGVPASVDVPVALAWARVMQDVQWVGKQRAEGLKYAFRGIDAIRAAVGPVLRKHGVVVLPVEASAEYDKVSRSGGGVMMYCRAKMRFQVIGPRGDMLPSAETMGEGFDTGDKSTMKAQSVCERSFYITALALPTEQPEMDPEHGKQYELAGEARPTAAQYAALALAEDVSLQRLTMIRQELVADKATAVTMIEEADGTKIRLIDLIDREGRQKRAQG